MHSVPLSQGIILNIERGQQDVLTRPVRSFMTQSVDFSQPMVRGSFDTAVHYIKFSEDICKTHPVIVLFPNHDDPNLQIVDSRTFSSRDSFNRTLNRRFKDSLEQVNGNTVRMAVCYGEHVFICDGMTGTPYVLWAEVKSIKGSTVLKTQNQPFVFNLNGMGPVKCIYRLVARVENENDLKCMPITKKSPRLIFTCENVPFVNETRPERNSPIQLKTISLKDATAMMTDLSVRSTQEQRYHLQEYTTDGEQSVDLDAITHFIANEECILGPDDGSVSADPLQLSQAIALHAKDPSITPPILDSTSEYDQGEDPFK